MWIEPLEQIAARMAWVTAQAQACGRTVTFGLRTHLVVRDDPDAAWGAAESLIAHADPHVVQQRQAVMVGTPMVDRRPRRDGWPNIGSAPISGMACPRSGSTAALPWSARRSR